MNYYLSRFLFVFVTAWSVNCASFRANNLPVIQDNEYLTPKTSKIKVFSRWNYVTSANDGVLWAAAHKSWFDKAVIESGCCEIVESPKDAAIVLDGTATDHTSPGLMIPLIINASTLTIIPFWQTITADVKATATKGPKQTSYEVKDSFTYVSWLPMMFVYPFTGGAAKNKEELLHNTHKNLFVQMKKDGLL